MKETAENNKLMSVIAARRSVRRYAGEPLTDDKLSAAVRVLDHAPAYGGERCCRFVIARDPELRDRLVSAATGGLKGLVNKWLTKGVPAMIAATADPALSGRCHDRRFYLSDTAAAMEMLVLAARENGLGTCWIGAFDEISARKALGLDSKTRVVALSPLGAPFGGKPEMTDIAAHYDRMAEGAMHKKRLPLDDIVFSNTYGDEMTLPYRDSALKKGVCAGAQPGRAVETAARALRFAKSFTSRDLNRELLAHMLEAARLAPSANNSQPWRFIAVDSPEQLKALETAADDDNGLPIPFSSAPMVLAATAATGIIADRGPEQPYFMIDVPIALSHILLTAADQGVAANVTFDFQEKHVKRILKLPDDQRVVALVALGYEAAEGEEFPVSYKRPEASEPAFIVI